MTREPDAVIRHPEYVGSTLNNDVCLLHVAEPMVFDETTVPVCVPPAYTGHRSHRRLNKLDLYLNIQSNDTHYEGSIRCY